MRAAAGGIPLPGVDIEIFDDEGQRVDWSSTDERGDYRCEGLWPGVYYIATDERYFDFVDQLYQAIPCPQGPFEGCDPLTGDPVGLGFNATVRGLDFNLEPTGTITGIVTAFIMRRMSSGSLIRATPP